MNPQINQEVAQEKLDEVDKKVLTSSVAQKLPTEIRSLSLEDILLFTLVLKLAYFFPTYIIQSPVRKLMSSNDTFHKIFEFIKDQPTWLIIIDFIFTGSIYLLGLKDFVKLAWISFAVKNIVVVIFELFALYKAPGLIERMAHIGFTACCVVIDLSFIFYLNFHFQNLEEDSKKDPEDKV